jgi:hypothetical protein
MTGRIEFTASIQSEVRFGKTRTLPKEGSPSTERVVWDYGSAQAISLEDEFCRSEER